MEIQMKLDEVSGAGSPLGLLHDLAKDQNYKKIPSFALLLSVF